MLVMLQFPKYLGTFKLSEYFDRCISTLVGKEAAGQTQSF